MGKKYTRKSFVRWLRSLSPNKLVGSEYLCPIATYLHKDSEKPDSMDAIRLSTRALRLDHQVARLIDDYNYPWEKMTASKLLKILKKSGLAL